MQSIVITSIAEDKHPILTQYAKEAEIHNTEFILIGDEKSPKNFYLKNCNFFSIEQQEKLPFKLAKELPYNHYSRKNIGYLIAQQKGADIIIETDDDNIPYSEFWNQREIIYRTKVFENTGWINIYQFFTTKKVWTRGFPLEFINQNNSFNYEIKSVTCPIQQGLADINPDVDAIFRLTDGSEITFKQNKSIALGKNSLSPFNSQNTTWFRQAFPLMYLPTYCSFRMTDIWRSFVAQRIAWTCGWYILFHSPTVYQQRNQHVLLKDFEHEIPGYLNNHKIMQTLLELNLKNGVENIFDNLILIYQVLIKNKWITDKKELNLLEKWIIDLQKLGF